MSQATLVEVIEAQMRNFEKIQNNSYDELVLPSILIGDDDAFEQGYKQYIDRLDHFDATAYKATITHILNDTPEIVDQFSMQFPYVAEYAIARNNFDKKTKEIFDMDGSQHDKQAIFDTLDRNRTKAHNGVIALFNNLNKYATENGIAEPYPNNGQPYDKADQHDREVVAGVMKHHQPLLENCNELVKEEIINKNIQSSVDTFRTMTPTEILRFMHTDIDGYLDSLHHTDEAAL